MKPSMLSMVVDATMPMDQMLPLICSEKLLRSTVSPSMMELAPTLMIADIGEAWKSAEVLLVVLNLEETPSTLFLQMAKHASNSEDNWWPTHKLMLPLDLNSQREEWQWMQAAALVMASKPDTKDGPKTSMASISPSGWLEIALFQPLYEVI